MSTAAIYTRRPRSRAAVVASTSALLATAIVAAPASANACGTLDGAAGTAREFLCELDAAGASSAASVSIELTDDFAYGMGYAGLYEGTADLTINGNGHTVTGPGTVAPTDPPIPDIFLSVIAPAGQDSQTPYAPRISLNDITVQDFVSVGALYSQSQGALELSNTAFVDNAVTQFSPGNSIFTAGVVSAAGPIEASDSEFSGNAGIYGGALSNIDLGLAGASAPSIDIASSTFTGNSARAGGAATSDGDIRVTASTFDSNSARIGGAIAAALSLEADTSYFVDNDAYLDFDESDPVGSRAGGAMIVSGDVSIESSTFEGNAAPLGGAITFTSANGPDDDYAPSSFAVSTSTFAGNTATDIAGAIAVMQMPGLQTTVVNSTFTGNRVDNAFGDSELAGEDAPVAFAAGAFAYVPLDTFGGGPVSDEPSQTTLAYNTFAGNSGGDADSFAVSGDAANTAELTGNALVSGDADSCAFHGIGVATTDNFDGDGSCTSAWSGDGDIGAGLDAMLGALADNGGSTKTLMPGEGSPLIDAIALTSDECLVDTDQRGTVRPQGDACDIGAIEAPAAATAPTEPPTDHATDPVEFSFETAKGTVIAHVYGATSVSNIAWTAAADITSAPPAGLVLPLGIGAFDLVVPNAGDTVTIELTLPLAVTQLWKVQNGTWSQVDGASVSGTSISYELTDGQAGDEDGIANAIIVDPIAPAVSAAFTG